MSSTHGPDIVLQLRERCNLVNREKVLEEKRLVYMKSDLYPNSEFVPEREARLSIFDRGYTIGDSAYEYARTYRHKPFQVKEHMDRMFTSLKTLRINPGMSHAEFCDLCEELTARNVSLLEDHEEFNIVWEVTRGEWGWHGRRPPIDEGQGQPTIIIKNNLNDQIGCAPSFSVGIHMVTPPGRHVSPQAWDPKIKTYSRLNYVLAGLETRLVDRRATPLMLDGNGNLSEAVGGNIWLVMDGVLMTPTDSNILRGQTRNNVMTIAGQLGIPVVERDLQPWHLYNCDEAFHTSTAPGPMMPIGSYNGMLIGKNLPGPITKALASAWSEWVGIDITGQDRLTPEDRTALEEEGARLNEERGEITHIPF